VSHRATPANTAELTAEIVSAYVSNNETAPSDVAALITAVAGQLSRIGTEPEQAEIKKPEPAVPIRRSIQRDHLLCLVCGKPQKVLKRHLAVRHELSPAEYRALRAQAGVSDDGAKVRPGTAGGGARDWFGEEAGSAWKEDERTAAAGSQLIRRRSGQAAAQSGRAGSDTDARASSGPTIHAMTQPPASSCCRHTTVPGTKAATGLCSSPATRRATSFPIDGR